jgi:hypothetical protein
MVEEDVDGVRRRGLRVSIDAFNDVCERSNGAEYVVVRAMLSPLVESNPVLLISKADPDGCCDVGEFGMVVGDQTTISIEERDVVDREEFRPAAVLHMGVFATVAGEKEGTDQQLGLSDEDRVGGM